MATVAAPPPTRKAPRAYYAHLYDEAGSVTQLPDGVIYFMSSDTGALTPVEPEHLNFLTVLGEIGLCDTQQLMDHMRHGYAAIACSRAN
jgi:hypothetical protein